MRAQTGRTSFSTGRNAWEDLAERAEVYLSASAWRSAELLLAGPLTREWESLPRESLLALSQLVFSWRRLGRIAPTRDGIARIRKLIGVGQELTCDEAALSALCLALREFDRGDLCAAVKLLEESRACGSDALSPWTECRHEQLLGKIALFRGDLAEAEHRGLTAAGLAAQARSEGQSGDAYILLGSVAKRRGYLREANALYGKAAVHYWQAGDESAQGIVALDRAIVTAMLGRVRKGEVCFREARSLARTALRPATELRASLGLGVCLARQGKHHAARSALLACWRKARRLGLLREELIALEYYAEATLLAMAPSKALIALGLARRLSDSMSYEADVDIQLGLQEAAARLQSAEGSSALGLCRSVAQQAEQSGLLWETCVALRIRGVGAIRLAKRGEGRECLLAAQKLLLIMSECLEHALVTAWLIGLEESSPKRALAKLREYAATLKQEQDAILYWLNHPLWGPIPWFEKKADRRRGRSKGKGSRPVVAENTQGGATPLSTKVMNAHVDLEAAEMWAGLGLVTRSPRMKNMLRTAETYAGGKLPALILGETGTGKDLIAQGVHELSERRGTFVPVNCAAASRELFAAELFGARRGAYTGATEHREGLIPRAQGGSIFLDEIADLNLEAQGYLLRFLDSGEVRPVGSVDSVRIDTRVIAATCRNLREMVGEGLFRSDLLNRLSGLRLMTPALRDRTEDLELLIDSLWRREGGADNSWHTIFQGPVLARMCRHEWPGNVRELRHMVTRALEFCGKHGEASSRREVIRSFDEMEHQETSSATST